jgi:hypothetical protein
MKQVSIGGIRCRSKVEGGQLLKKLTGCRNNGYYYIKRLQWKEPIISGFPIMYF